MNSTCRLWPGNVELPARQSGLPSASVANVSQIVTLDRTFLRTQVGTLPHALMQRISEGLKSVLELK